MPQPYLNLPAPGTMVPMSPAFMPAMIKGLQLDLENPLKFNFIVDTGDTKLQGDALKSESTKLIKYFLTALTVPEDQLWVNLSPYEKDRIAADGLGKTEMGRDMLAQDYILKQMTASLIYPEGNTGKKFWEKIYVKAREKYGTTDVPVSTFNKVWIVPEHALIYEKNGTAYVVENKLKVMLEEDYLALMKNMGNAEIGLDKTSKGEAKDFSKTSSDVVRELVIPELEKEVNAGKNFANLRQIANAVVLATWYKQNLKESLLGQVYVNQNKIKGVDAEDKNAKLKIYNQYLEAFKKGAYNYIKEEYDFATRDVVIRKYFSGGAVLDYTDKVSVVMPGQSSSGAAEREIAQGSHRGKESMVAWVAVENAARGTLEQAIQASSSGAPAMVGTPVSIPQRFGKVLAGEKYGLVASDIRVSVVKGIGDIHSLLSDFKVRYILESSTAAALGSFFLRGQRSTPSKLDVKKAADANALKFIEDETARFVAEHPEYSVVELASEGLRDGSVSTPVGRIYHQGLGENNYIDTVAFEFDAKGKGKIRSFDKDRYVSTLDQLRVKGVTILYKISDSLEKTEGLVAPEAKDNPTDSWAMNTFMVDTGTGPYRLPIDDNFRTAGISYHALKKAEDLGPLDLPSVAIPKIARANGITLFDAQGNITSEYKAFLEKVVMVTLGPRGISIKDADSSDERHAAIIADGLRFMEAMHTGYEVQLRDEAGQTEGMSMSPVSDGDLITRLAALSGSMELTDNKIYIDFGRSGSAEAEAARAFAKTVPGARMVSRRVSTAATAKNVSYEKADGYANEEREVNAMLGYEDGALTQVSYDEEQKVPTYVSMTSVTGATNHLGNNFRDAMQRVTVNPDNKTITTTTLMTDAQGNIYTVQVDYKSSKPALRDSIREVLNAHPLAQAVVNEMPELVPPAASSGAGMLAASEIQRRSIEMRDSIYFGGNWKERKNIATEEQARAKAREFKAKFATLPADTAAKAKIIIFSEAKWVKVIAEELKGSGILVGVQSLFFDPEGDLRAQIDQAVQMGATYANVAHSMHRAKGLTNEQANKIMRAILEDGRLIPWYTIEETGTRDPKEEISQAIDIGLKGIPAEVIATFPTTLEPTVLISTQSGTGVINPNLKVSGADALQRTMSVRDFFRSKYHSEAIANDSNVGYGASVKSSNAQEIFSQPVVRNALIGGASLEADEFFNLVVNAIKASPARASASSGARMGKVGSEVKFQRSTDQIKWIRRAWGRGKLESIEKDILSDLLELVKTLSEQDLEGEAYWKTVDLFTEIIVPPNVFLSVDEAPAWLKAKKIYDMKFGELIANAVLKLYAVYKRQGHSAFSGSVVKSRFKFSLEQYQKNSLARMYGLSLSLQKGPIERLIENGAKYSDKTKSLLLITPQQFNDLPPGTVLKTRRDPYLSVTVGGKEAIDKTIQDGVLMYGIDLSGAEELQAASTSASSSGARMVEGAEIVPVDDIHRQPRADGDPRIKFETAGWRGRIDVLGDFSIENVGRFTAGTAEEFLQRVQDGTYTPVSPKAGIKILVAYDSREGGDHYAQEIYEVLSAHQGIIPVMSDGILHTPGVTAQTRESLAEYDGAIQVTASHNEPGWLGLKFLHRGSVNPKSWTNYTEKRANDKRSYPRLNHSENLKSLSEFRTDNVVTQLTARYRQIFPDLGDRFAAFKSKHGTTHILDVMHGGLVDFVSMLTSWNLSALNTSPMRDRTYPKTTNKGTIWKPDPTKKENLDHVKLQEFERNAPDGSTFMATDGDGDRLVNYVKRNGVAYEIEPNIFAPFAIWYLNKKGMVPQDAKIVVRSMATSRLMDAVAKKLGYTLEVTPVGSRFFEPYMIDSSQRKAAVAVEETGHIAIRVKSKDGGVDEVFFDDTVFQIGLLLSMMADEDKGLDKLLDEFETFVQFTGVFRRDDPKGVKEQIVKALGENPRTVAQKIIDAFPGKRVIDSWVVVEVGETDETTRSIKDLNPTDKIKVNEGVGVQWDDYSWGLIRVSGTEDSGRVYSFGTPEERPRIQDALYAAVGLQEFGATRRDSTVTASSSIESVDEDENFGKSSRASSSPDAGMMGLTGGRSWTSYGELPLRTFLKQFILGTPVAVTQRKGPLIRGTYQGPMQRYVKSVNTDVGMVVETRDPSTGSTHRKEISEANISTIYMDRARLPNELSGGQASSSAVDLTQGHSPVDLFNILSTDANARAQLVKEETTIRIDDEIYGIFERLEFDHIERGTKVIGITTVQSDRHEILWNTNNARTIAIHKIAPATASSSNVEGQKQNLGGINLNPALLNLQIKRDGNGIPLPMPQQPIGTMKIEGFMPVIINITPITNLPLMLGIGSKESRSDELSLKK